MPAQYTGITLTAGQGLLQNQGLEVPKELFDSLSLYNNVSIVSQFTDIVTNAQSNLNQSTTQLLQSLGNATLPSATNAIPSPYTTSLGLTYVTGLSGYVANRANFLIGNGDLSKFAQIISSVDSYKAQADSYINAANNSGLYDPLFNFPGENNLITANFSDLSDDLTKFGPDFSRAGLNINLRNINNLGSPVTVIQNLNIGGGVPNSVIVALLNQGIPADVVSQLADVNYAISNNNNLLVYQALQTITGNDLAQCLKILKCATVGLTSLADVLNPAKLFPDSYLTMMVRYGNGIYRVYAGNYTINPVLPNLGSRLNSIIPPDQAQAWYALERDLTAVKGIENMTAKSAGILMSTLETVTDLPLIASFDQYVPANTQTYWNQEFGMGTGPGNTITVYNTIGTVVGSPETQSFETATVNLANFNFSELINVYSLMSNTLNGLYGNLNSNISIPGYPTYANANVAFVSGLIPNANIALANIATTDPTSNTQCWSAWSNIGQQLAGENQFLDISGLNDNSANVLQPDSEPSTLALISSLHTYGLDTADGGYSDLLTNLANTQTIYGQAVIASLREGRNIVKIDAAGVQLDAGLDPTPTP